MSKLTQLVSKEFENAKTKLNTLKEDPGNDVKLKIGKNLEEKIDFKEEKKERELPLNTELI